MRIYITHCCALKEPSLRGTGKAVTPDVLYLESPTREFMDKCMSTDDVTWAIFSDLYGVWFSPVEHEWYEKNPDTLTDEEYEALRSNFDDQLAPFTEIYFYYPDEVHPFHRRLLDETILADRVKLFTQLSEIV